MGNERPSDPADRARRGGRSLGWRRSHIARHAAKPQEHSSSGRSESTTLRGRRGRVTSAVLDYLPRGNTLDQDTFSRRHALLCWVLGLHVPALFAFGVWQGYGAGHAAAEIAAPVACLVLARLAKNRRVAAFFVTAGLVYCSSALVHLSRGTIEAHFHFFILIGLIALYQDWVPFLWNVTFTVLSHGLGSGIAADLMYNHGAAQSQPWTWAVIHGLAVLAACVGVIVFWKSTEQEQRRNVSLVAEVAAAEAERREAVSELLVNLARRNQSLVNRQLQVINDLQQHEPQPDVTRALVGLDQLATRIRRNAESLLVLSGDEPSRRWGDPLPLSDVVRAAATEVEDGGRVAVLVDDHVAVAGRAVADLAHLLAELIENATTYSPPGSEVRVRSHVTRSDPTAFVVSVEDIGIGMSEDDMRTANTLLAEAPDVDLRQSTRLGFHVVARLSRRNGIDVRLVDTPAGGLTALVDLPTDVMIEQPARTPIATGATALPDRYRRAAAAWSDAHGPAVARRSALTATAGGTSAQPELEHSSPSRPAISWPHAPPAPADAPPHVPSLPQPQPALAASQEDAQAAPQQSPAATAWADSQAAAPTHIGPGATRTWWTALVRAREQPAAGSSPSGPVAGWIASPVADPATDAPADVAARPTGLAHRVPGTHLAPSLRREPAHPPATSANKRDPERVSSMLSRFQASQRAGRAAADSPGAGQADGGARSPEEV
jgi:signal transduction histidine kinase